jgi:hypothetical protein
VTPEDLNVAQNCLLAVRRLATLASNLSHFRDLTADEWAKYAKLLVENGREVIDGFAKLQDCTAHVVPLVK